MRVGDEWKVALSWEQKEVWYPLCHYSIQIL